MKKIIIIACLMLSACQTSDPKLIKEKLKLVRPSDNLFHCPTITTFPNPDNLTDIQVARLIVQLYQNNITCKNSIEAIKRFLNEAEARTR